MAFEAVVGANSLALTEGGLSEAAEEGVAAGGALLDEDAEGGGGVMAAVAALFVPLALAGAAFT